MVSTIGLYTLRRSVHADPSWFYLANTRTAVSRSLISVVTSFSSCNRIVSTYITRVLPNKRANERRLYLALR